MTALAMCYAVVISVPLTALGLLVEHVAALQRRSRRWGWAAGLATAVILTALTPWRALPAPRAAARIESRGTDVAALTIRSGSRAAEPQSTWSIWRTRIDAQVDAVQRSVVRADSWARWVWPLASASLLLLYALGRSALARRRRIWREAIVHDEPVLVAHEDGPAIVGVLAPRIVIPEWALSLDPAAIRLMLRHEHEHRRARDPLLIHLASLALVVMPWNPLVWWMWSRLRLAAELDCDARVLGITPGRAPVSTSDLSIYGELLLAVVSRRSSRRQLIAPAMLEHPSSLTRRISAMYSHRARLIGLRVGAAGSAALVTIALTLVVPVPRLGAQSKETPGVTSRVAGPSTAPSFRAPAIAEVKTLVTQYAPEVQRGERPMTVVLVLDASGNVIGTQSTQVLERLIALTRPAAKQEPVWPEDQARERRAREREEREKAEVRQAERAEPKPDKPQIEAKAAPSSEDEARAKRALADQEAAELATRLIAIDVVRYAAGELAPAPVNVFFITTGGSGKSVK
jgi:bla regulator protein blaR1